MEHKNGNNVEKYVPIFSHSKDTNTLRYAFVHLSSVLSIDCGKSSIWDAPNLRTINTFFPLYTLNEFIRKVFQV